MKPASKLTTKFVGERRRGSLVQSLVTKDASFRTIFMAEIVPLRISRIECAKP